MKQAFMQKFSRYTPTEKEGKALENLSDFSIKIDKERRIITAALTFSCYVPLELIYSLEANIRALYGLNDVLFRPRFTGVAFEEKHARGLIAVFSRFDGEGVAKGFFDGCDFTFNGERLTIKLRRGLDPSYLYRVGADRFFEECIAAQFEGGAVKVGFAGNAEYVFQSAEADALEKEAAERMREYQAKQQAKTAAEAELLRKREEAKESPKDSSVDGSSVDKEAHAEGDEGVYTCGKIRFDLRDKEVVYGRPTAAAPTPIAALEKERKGTVCGEVFLVEKKESRDGTRVNYKIYITDLSSSVIVRVSEGIEGALVGIKSKHCVLVEGKYTFDPYDEEYILKASALCRIKRINRVDTHPTPRVELHLHTNMSASDALCDTGALVALAEKWNMPAIAVTDHGNAQAYPELMAATTKKRGGPSPVKPIYGMEGYLVDDTARAVFGYTEAYNKSLSNDEFVIFDIETTGLSPVSCGITQIGAVIYKGGQVTEEFETYVNPAMPIPEEITRLTGISDDTVKDAPTEKEAVSAFLEFCGDRMLIAHNAPFDTSFIRKVAGRDGLDFDNPYLDTVSLSRYVNAELSRHKLNLLAEYYNLGEFDHHRATDDTKMLAAIFACMVEKLKKQGVYTVGEMLDAMSGSSDPKKIKDVYHISILVKNKTGLKNLYKIISSSYLDSFFRVPRIPKTVLSQHREGLIIGSACERGELYRAVLEGKKYGDQLKIADYYDYFEIMPNCNNAFLIEAGEVRDEAALCEINRKIVAIGAKQNKPVCATGDVHFINPEDEIYRKVMLWVKKMKGADSDVGLYLRTTDEMLEEFAYLGKETAFDVVVTNTRKIADMIETVLPIPDGQYTPELPGAAQELERLCYEEAENRFGSPLPQVVSDRLEKELNSIVEHGFASLYMIAVKLVKNSEENGYLVGSRGSVGSSVVASLSGISEVDPFPPHYRCPKCKHSIFFLDGSVGSGFDLPDKDCPQCGTRMHNDGHDIPFETFLGFKGDKAPDIDLNFSGEIQGKSHKYTEVLFGAENIFRAGTVSGIAEKTAFGYAKKYAEEHGKNLSKAEISRLAAGCTGVKRTTGQHPGGIVVIPKEYQIYDFTAVQYPAEKESSGVVTTHFAFEYLHDTLLKLDMLGHDVPTIYKKLTDYTGIDVRTVPMNDRKVMDLFLSTKSLGVDPETIGSETGTYGMPECGTPYVRKMLKVARPKCFSDLLQISGLSHGTGIWLGNGEDLINNGTCTISEIIGTRDSIMLYLIKKGVNYQSAFKIMEDVRKGKGVKPEYEEEMLAASVPEWYIESCKKIKYMFPKAHAAAYMIAALRLGWFKVHRPMEFYAAYFTVKQTGFDAELMLNKESSEKARTELEGLMAPTAKEEETLSILYLVIEMQARGIEFLPVDVFKSQAFAFIPENGKIRLPLSSLNGLGETAAENIYKAIHEEGASTLEELKRKAGLTKTVVEVLKKNGAVDSLPESDQITLF
ncbi:MAG: PolC-type DNA polymerase III [Clostridia bacterium]|nr:PolC-type DNA polymerase III [Clostridia bacterium]